VRAKDAAGNASGWTSIAYTALPTDGLAIKITP
jgi:hypothetical protein